MVSAVVLPVDNLIESLPPATFKLIVSGGLSLNDEKDISKFKF